ncbi:fibroblast growth factor-binding protein 1 [Stegastes partitus]|uniref:Fibroblast growth factor-binding protein 1 n=1 Tax=Stegastes partitus TaxID=144197 RepID=A0A9Y4NB89_9TELE|nr:PREDICTED: fibroblast growth factor-binding protein 1 [Stegastes partitus]
MLLLRTLAPCLLLAFLGQQVSLSSAARSADKLTGRAQRSDNKGARGKFSTRDKMQCTWSVRVVGDTVKLPVKCENPEARIKGGVTDLSCEYNAKPATCPGYLSDPRGFWKQVGRALKKLQSKVCKDERALVKAGMCKRAPKDAHFKLNIFSSVSAAQSGDVPTPPPRTTTTTSSPGTGTGPTACTKRADHSKTAEDYCSSSWASVCSFFLSMLQSEDC